MTWKRRIPLWIVPAAALLVAVAAFLLFRFANRKPVVLKGAITAQDEDPRKQLPISDVTVTEKSGQVTATAKSDASGLFSFVMQPAARRGDPITLEFRHPEYSPFDLHDFAGDKLYIVQMAPLAMKKPIDSNQPPVRVSNVRARYTSKALSAVNIGSAVSTFQITNTGNVPCKGQHPCSPDGKWKAAINSASLDAGVGNEFRNARASCIAGPCPFTRIETDHFSQGGRMISVSARAWSDTATYLLEAEVFHPMVSETVHESYPVIFGETLNFSAPAGAEGVCIEADINGETILFPLGPNLYLSWASCTQRTESDQTTVYTCELKPGFQFR